MITNSRKRRHLGGFTLSECVVSLCVVTMLTAAALSTSTQAIIITRMGHEQAAASQVLQQRFEQLRVANWSRVTDPSWLSNNTLLKDAPGAESLPGLSETVCIKPYGSSTTTNTFSRVNGAAVSGGTKASLSTQDSVQVTWILTWTGAPSTHGNNRLAVAILGKGGVAK